MLKKVPVASPSCRLLTEILLRAICVVVVALACRIAAVAQSSDPDAACASCHRSIYERYRKTPMARGSGAAAEGFLAADLLHTASGVHYRITSDEGKVFLSYERPPSAAGGALSGRVELLYYVGSGTRGRTFLFEREGYLFEIPINWYAKKGIWDMAPSYQRAEEMPLTLPVDSSCLHCHASGVRAAMPEARNRYAAAPFAAGGITCERCHGDPSQHLAENGKGPILNPDKLAANLRDSICLQCHLEAEVTVNRRGRTLYDYQPGAEISDYVVRFVHRDAEGAGGRATSQWEALLQSACKRSSGDRLTCTTCHDPHGSPAAKESVAFYRGKCLACHTGPRFQTAHHSEQPDCASCHMPRSPTRDIAHEQVTDHRIQIPQPAPIEQLGAAHGSKNHSSDELVSVRGQAGARDLGIAYSQLALRGDRQAGEEALRLLREAERDPGAQHLPDADLHTELGFLDQLNQDSAAAEKQYRLALAANPYDGTAMGNTAFIDARAGDAAAAARLWATVFERDPTQKAAGFNLAVIECQLGDAAAATRVLERMLTFSPDNQQARKLAHEISAGAEPCRKP